jgi:hypothetical protein
VLAFLGGVLLVSEMRVSARVQRNLDAKDAANRAIDLIRREANFSSRIDSGDASFSSPLSCNISTLIFYQKDPTRPICYKTVTPSQLTHIGAFEGPCVLVRIGYPYRATGDIDDLSSGNMTSVLLDGLAKRGSNSDCSSEGNRAFTSQIAALPYPAGAEVAPPNRIANMQILMASSASYGFSVRVPSNLVHDGINLLRKCLRSDGVCENNSSQVHYLPEISRETDFRGHDSKENFFYFEYPHNQYQVTGNSNTGTCTYSNCTVTGRGKEFKLANVDALIFPDKEIRPTR